MTGEHDIVTGQAAVDALVRILDLERIEEDIFRGVSPKERSQRVFGGQVAGQALIAAGRTVPEDRRVHSLHGYFIRPGDPAVPIVYTVTRERDGRSFNIRRVIGLQHGKTIFMLSASFQKPQEGIEHQEPFPDDVPDPLSLPSWREQYAGQPQLERWFTSEPRPLDLRYITPPAWVRESGDDSRTQRVWVRADGELPDDPLLHVCVLTYASDITLLDTVVKRHALSMLLDRIKLASLDHAMWFERPFRIDDWVLYESRTPSASGGRGLAAGRFYSRDGRQIASVVQEGMIRVPEDLRESHSG